MLCLLHVRRGVSIFRGTDTFSRLFWSLNMIVSAVTRTHPGDDISGFGRRTRGSTRQWTAHAAASCFKAKQYALAGMLYDMSNSLIYKVLQCAVIITVFHRLDNIK